MIKRTIVIGDVHGCLDEFKTLLDKCKYSSDDRLIVAGDLVDRGPDSPGVVRLAIALGAECVAGNHEDKLVRRYKHILRRKMDPKYKIPMKENPEQEQIINDLTPGELHWLKFLPTYIRLPDFNAVVIHAGMAPGVALEHQARESLTMMRFIDKETHKMLPLVMPGFKQPENSLYWTELYDMSEDVIFGHNVVSLKEPKIWENAVGARCIGIDTGACFGGMLTACILDPENPFERTFVQVPALKAYKGFGGEVA